MELFRMQEGRCAHILNGNEMELAPNDFGIVMPEDLHGFRWIGGRSYRIVNLAFFPDILRKILKRHCLEKDPLWVIMTEKIRIRSLSTKGGAWLDNEFMALRKRVPSELTLEHFLLSLIMKISPSAEGTFDKCPPWLRGGKTFVCFNAYT
jgi:hypothetical protein